ncbi:MAG TPA: 50S ribosomal protein L17, partial [Rhodospirillaceae bacterium]|nr:50S ribosomal protein L17 [Rhodospirillaceae bacterium]
MKHRIKQKKLNRTTSHRKAMLANMAASLVKHEQIVTTLPKAKTLRPFVEKLVTLGKQAAAKPESALAKRRQAISIMRDK